MIANDEYYNKIVQDRDSITMDNDSRSILDEYVSYINDNLSKVHNDMYDNNDHDDATPVKRIDTISPYNNDAYNTYSDKIPIHVPKSHIKINP